VSGECFLSGRPEASKFGAVDVKQALDPVGIGFELTDERLDAGDVGSAKTVELRVVEPGKALYGNDLRLAGSHLDSVAQGLGA
jgi:hypothetical protein